MRKRRRPNQHPENPHPPGTLAAAGWDLNRAMLDLLRAIGIERVARWLTRQIEKRRR